MVLLILLTDCDDIDDDNGPYRGKLIGTFNTYHHQVGLHQSYLRLSYLRTIL